MRLSELKIDLKSSIIELESVNYSKPCVIIISDGQAKFAELPDFAETSIITHGGKVRRVKFDEGVEF